MKKRLLCILLLGVSFGAPAFADGDSVVIYDNPNADQSMLGQNGNTSRKSAIECPRKLAKEYANAIANGSGGRGTDAVSGTAL